MYQQKTIEKEVFLNGIGLFTGAKVSILLKPAKENTGIIFKRVDIENNKTSIFANLSFVQQTPRSTILGDGKVNILTVEHLLSAIGAFEIDNLIIEVKGPEIPVGDGSANIFVDLIEKAKVVEQKENKKILKLLKPMHWSKKEVHIIAIPSDEYKISYLLNYPNSKILKSQYYTCVVTPSSYKKEIASARTFSLYEEIEPFLKKGLIKGGGLSNALVIKEDKILNPDGIRFEEEMARHKILDLIGDLSLIGKKINAHIIAIRSGHFSNISFAKKLIDEV